MINKQYKEALKKIYYNGNIIKPRGMEVKEILGYTFRLDNINDNIITIPGFETNLRYAKEELNWYLSGTNKINFSPLIKKIWTKYSDDGIHANSAYGYRIFGNHPLMKNQWEQVKEELKNDSDSRRAIININSYFDKDNPNSKDIPCTIAIQSFIRNNSLDWIVYMRSNDINKGFRNDVFCFTELQKKLSHELKLNYGNYIHIVGSMHLYKEDYKKIEELFK